MSTANWLQLAILIALLLVSTRVIGAYVAGVFGGGKALGDRVFLPVERLVYRICGVDPGREQTLARLRLSLLAFSLVSVLGLYALQRLQGSLPLNPTDAASVPPALAFNTAVQLRDEHELAELRRRVDDEPPDPDGRPRGAELRLGRGRAVRGGGADPRPRAAEVDHDRELLGRPHPRHDPAAAAARRRLRARPRRARGSSRTSTASRRHRRCRARRSRSPAARWRARR